MKTLFVLFFILAVNLFAQDIYMQDGSIYKNVNIIEESDTAIVFLFNNVKEKINRENVSYIDSVSYNKDHPSKILFSLSKKIELNQKQNINVEKPYLPFLIVSVLSATFAYQNFEDASDLDDMISRYKTLGLDTGTLESQQTRKKIVGYVCIVGCLVATYVSFLEVEVKPNSNMVSFSYNF